MAGPAEVHIPVEPGLVHRMVGIQDTRVIGAEPLRLVRQNGHTAAEISDHVAWIATRIAEVIGQERRKLNTRMFRAIRIGHLVAELALDTVRVEPPQCGAVGRRGPPIVPPAWRVAAQAEVAGAVEVLLGDGHGRPEDRVAGGVCHHVPGPDLADASWGLPGIRLVTVDARFVEGTVRPDRRGRPLGRRNQRRNFHRLGSRLLDFGRDELRPNGGSNQCGKAQQKWSEEPDIHDCFSLVSLY